MRVQKLAEFLDSGDELSAQHAPASSAGTWDCVHVAAARRCHAEVFITCDAAQAELARLSGLPGVHLFDQ
jgi:hypothetical protein